MCKRKKNKNNNNQWNKNQNQGASSGPSTSATYDIDQSTSPSSDEEAEKMILEEVLGKDGMEKALKRHQKSSQDSEEPSLEAQMTKLNVGERPKSGFVDNSWLFDDNEILNTHRDSRLEELKNQLDDSKKMEALLQKTNNDLREIVLHCADKNMELQEQYNNVIGVLATVTEQLSNTVPNHPSQCLKLYQELKASLQEGEVFNQGRMMLKQLMTLTSNSKIQRQAIKDSSDFYNDYKKYMEAVNKNISSIESSGSLEGCVELPQYPRIPKNLRDEYWKEVDQQLKLNATIEQRVDALRNLSCPHCNKKVLNDENL